MTLYDYLSLTPDGSEITVWDKDYDVEAYFYNDSPTDKWELTEVELSRLLTITEIAENGVTVNMSDVIFDHLTLLKEADLFIRCDIDSIMSDIHNILAGYVSENWLEQFVNILKQ